MKKREFWARFRRNKLAMSGLVMVGGLFLVSLFAPWLAPYDPGSINLQAALMPPDATHWLGTDPLGQDVLSRIIYGSQVSLKVGFVAVGLATVIGLIVGALSGYELVEVTDIRELERAYSDTRLLSDYRKILPESYAVLRRI